MNPNTPDNDQAKNQGEEPKVAEKLPAYDEEMPYYTQLLMKRQENGNPYGGANKVMPPNVIPISRPRDTSSQSASPRQTPVSGDWGVRYKIGRVLKPGTEKYSSNHRMDKE
jgi:hypothetical protein